MNVVSTLPAALDKLQVHDDELNPTFVVSCTDSGSQKNQTRDNLLHGTDLIFFGIIVESMRIMLSCCRVRSVNCIIKSSLTFSFGKYSRDGWQRASSDTSAQCRDNRRRDRKTSKLSQFDSSTAVVIYDQFRVPIDYSMPDSLHRALNSTVPFYIKNI